jgi:hypothetical protein
MVYGGRQKGAGKRDFALVCGVADCDAGIKPAGHASLVQGDDVVSGHYSRS